MYFVYCTVLIRRVQCSVQVHVQINNTDLAKLRGKNHKLNFQLKSDVVKKSYSIVLYSTVHKVLYNTNSLVAKPPRVPIKKQPVHFWLLVKKRTDISKTVENKKDVCNFNSNKKKICRTTIVKK